MSRETINVLSVGKVCEILQAAPSRITKAAQAAGVLPVWTINGVAHFAEIDLEKIAAHLRAK